MEIYTEDKLHFSAERNKIFYLLIPFWDMIS